MSISIMEFVVKLIIRGRNTPKYDGEIGSVIDGDVVITKNEDEIDAAEVIYNFFTEHGVDPNLKEIGDVIIDGFDKVTFNKPIGITIANLTIFCNNIEFTEQSRVMHIYNIEINSAEGDFFILRNSYVSTVRIESSNLSYIDLSENPSLEKIYIVDSPRIHEVFLPQNVTILHAINCGIDSMEVFRMKNIPKSLSEIDVSDNNLSDIDRLPFPSLKKFIAKNNQFTEIPKALSGAGLIEINLDGNPITDVRYPIIMNNAASDKSLSLKDTLLSEPVFKFDCNNTRRISVSIGGEMLTAVKIRDPIFGLAIHSSPNFTDLRNIDAKITELELEDLPIEKLEIDEGVKRLIVKNCNNLKFSPSDRFPQIVFARIEYTSVQPPLPPSLPTIEHLIIKTDYPIDIHDIPSYPNLLNLSLKSARSLDGIERYRLLASLDIEKPIPISEIAAHADTLRNLANLRLSVEIKRIVWEGKHIKIDSSYENISSWKEINELPYLDPNTEKYVGILLRDKDDEVTEREALNYILNWALRISDEDLERIKRVKFAFGHLNEMRDLVYEHIIAYRSEKLGKD